jgi:hypothetical protein
MTDNRRRGKRGVSLADLPKATRDKVMRDLPEFEPEHDDTVYVHMDGRKREPGMMGKAKRGGIERMTLAVHSAPNTTKATAAALASCAGAMKKAVAKAVKAAVSEPPKKLSRRQMAASEFAFQLRAHGFTDWEREHKFAKDDAWEQRLWRFDFANLKHKVAIEIEGLVVRMFRDMATGKPVRVVTGRHATITGMREDFRKYAAAEILGWHVIRVEQDMVANGEAIAFVERFLALRAYEQKQKVVRRKVKKP